MQMHAPIQAPAEPAPAPAPTARRYQYVSDWQLEAPPEAVWEALTDVPAWPEWWPHVRGVQTLRHGRRRGEQAGLGALRRIEWRTRLPYGFTLDVLVVEVQHARRLVGRASGGLEGTGTWELSPDDGAGTRVRYTWALALNTRWMRLAAPWMAPVFRWNHEGVMHAGALGLARRLGVALRRG